MEIQISADRWAVRGHHISNRHPLDGPFETNLEIALARSLQQEPADKRDPQAANTCTSEELQNAGTDEDECDCLADSRSDACRALHVAGLPPDERTQDAAAV